MLARVLLRTYLIELTLYGVAFGALWKGLGWAPGLVAALFVAVFVAIRLGLLGGMYRTAERHAMVRTPGLQIDALQGGRMVVREALALFRLYCWHHLFEAWLNPYGKIEDRPKGKNDLPVIFIHGFFCNGGFWLRIIPALEKAGFGRLYTINLDTPLHGISMHAEALAAAVEEVCGATGADQVVLVGHSMGGIVARTYVQRLDGDARVAAILSLGSPHHGTWHARRAIAPDAREMRIDCAWLNALNRETPKVVPIRSVYSAHDNIVAPQDSARLEHGENVALKGIGHLEMAYHPAIRAEITAFLNQFAEG